MKSLFIPFFFILSALTVRAQPTHQFALGKHEFLLDGKPVQLISGEMHPARIPRPYWQQRIRMAKAMGCNAIAVYIFWNYQETAPGVYDFKTGNKDVRAFIKLCQEEGMWVLLRPGPYVCAEWDFGGLPSYLLKTADIKLRCMDPRYMAAVTRYVNRLSQEVSDLQVTRGGPVLMLQVENEYGSYGNDRDYIKTLAAMWRSNEFTIPFYTADGPTAFMLEAGAVDSAAIGLDSGTGDDDFNLAETLHPGVPVFSSETYPGWLTHWKEKWQRPDTASLFKEVSYLMEHKRSVNLYVVHGGTNFGFTAGANAFTPVQFQPDLTSYDYDAPIDEQGRPTAKFFALRKLIAKYTGRKLPEVPAVIPAAAVPGFSMTPMTDVWSVLPAPVKSPQPLTMEALDQDNGLMLYRTKLIGHKSGKLTITEPHDFAMVYVDGKLVDSVYRDGGNWTIELPKTGTKDPVLEILVESMGHINFAQYMVDRKGITDRVTLNGMTLMNWEMFPMPLTDSAVSALKPVAMPDSLRRPGIFFKGTFGLQQPADTYLDMHGFQKGVVWVNGHNLGRYWNTGPQFRLYCPAPWLKKGNNEVVVLDLHQLKAATITGFEKQEP